MSRSFKHNAVIKDNSKFAKRKASKKARKIDLSNGGNYKKAYDSYKICDDKFVFDPLYNWTRKGILDFIRK